MSNLDQRDPANLDAKKLGGQINRPTSPPRLVQKESKLISLSKLKDFMQSSLHASQKIPEHLSGLVESRSNSSFALDNVSGGGLQKKPNSDLNRFSLTQDRYSLPVQFQRQSKASSPDIERNHVKKVGEADDGQCRSLRNHHQSRVVAGAQAEVATLNQFEIRVAQQEFEQPQSAVTLASRYGAAAYSATTNKSPTAALSVRDKARKKQEEVELTGDVNCSPKQDGSERQREQPDRSEFSTDREERKRKRISSRWQSVASKRTLTERTSSDDKQIRATYCIGGVNNNMTPSSQVNGQDLASINIDKQQQSSQHCYHQLGSKTSTTTSNIINENIALANNYISPQSRSSKGVYGVIGGDAQDLKSLRNANESNQKAIESLKFFPRSRDHDTEQVSQLQSSSALSQQSFGASTAAACDSDLAEAPLPIDKVAGQIKRFGSNSSISNDKETSCRTSHSPLEHSNSKQSGQILSAPSQAITANSRHLSLSDQSQRTARSGTSDINLQLAASNLTNSIDANHYNHQTFVDHRRHLAPYFVAGADRFVNDYHSTSLANQMVPSSSGAHNYHHPAQQQTQQRYPLLVDRNMNTLGGERGSKISSYLTESNRMGPLIDQPNASALMAACGISNPQQQHNPVITGSNSSSSSGNIQPNYSLMTSSKSSSPNSISLTPSPRAQDKLALAANNHSTNQLSSSTAGLNQYNTAMAVAEQHLDHSNHHYINNVALNHHHQHSQINHHYVYSQNTTGPIGTASQHPQNQHSLASHDQSSNYNQLQHQQQQAEQQQQQQLQQQQQQQQLQQPQTQLQQHQLQQQQQNQHQQALQQQQQNISSQQSIYHQIANGAGIGGVPGNTGAGANQSYANVGNSVHYHSQLQVGSNQAASNLMSEAHQSHLNTAAAACAAAAVVSQTLKTVANQHHTHHPHSHQHHHPYGSSIANGFGTSAGLMNMTAQHHQQFHGVNGFGHNHHNHAHHHTHHHPHHQHHHLMGPHHHGHVGIQTNQHQQQTPQHQQHVQALPVHQANHSIVTRKYQCKMCPQVFMSKAEMKYHNQNHLREAKPYKCLQCPKAFANSSYLSQHMRIHQGLKPYTCDTCSRKFTQLSHLQQHKRTHTGDKPYKCNYMNCTKQFSQLSNLQSHSRCHQLDKPYKCNSCYKCFHDEQSLLDHIPRHLESKHLKRNLCIFCGSSYQQERGLVKHFQQYHTDKSPTLVAAAIAAGTTGNTSLIASLVNSTQATEANKFATPSSGSTTSSVSSGSSTSSSSGSSSLISNPATRNVELIGQGVGHQGSCVANASLDVDGTSHAAHNDTSVSSATYQLSSSYQ